MSGNQTPEPAISFSGRAEHTPAIILQQLIQIHGLLGALFTIQIELLARLTHSDHEELVGEYTAKVNELTRQYALEAKDSLERQPPLE